MRYFNSADNYYESNGQINTQKTTTVDSQPKNLPTRLEIVFHPPDEATFKQLLLEKKRAWIALEKINGSTEIKEWSALRFTEDSSLKGNLQSGYLRNWKTRGICKAILAIDKDDLSKN